MANSSKKSAEPPAEVHDPTKLRGRLKCIGGSMSDDWNNILANQTVRRAASGLPQRLHGMLSPRHDWRADIRGKGENLNQANKLSRKYATLLETLNRHRGKGAQKVTVEHVHVHEGGQAIVGNVESPGGRVRIEIKGTTPCTCTCTRHPDAKREHVAGARASRQRCRTADVGCTAERLRAHRRGKPLPAGEKSQNLSVPRSN